MEKQQDFTEAQVSILLWLKALDDFESSACKTFNEKYNAFEEVDGTGYTGTEYMELVDFWAGRGILKEEEKGYSLTETGKKLFKKLDEMEGRSDEEVRKKLNDIRNVKEKMDEIKEFIKDHLPEILTAISLTLQILD